MSDEKTIKINTNIFLPDVVSSIKRGEWKIPRFQRDFVWGKKKVIELLDSIYKGFPIGSFFLWIPPEEYMHYYKDIPELKIDLHSCRYITHFILDGQQRLTSLYVLDRGLTIDDFDYSNICFNLDNDKFNTDPKDTEKNISVTQLLHLDENLALYDKLTDERKKKWMKIKNAFSKYPFPVIVIEDKNIEEACKIFERINQSGKKLSIFDLVVAITWDKDFELKKEIDTFIADNKIKETFGDIDYVVFSETLSLILNKQCTKAFQLKLKPASVKEAWADIVKAIGESIQFLRTHLKVKSYEYLPYRDMIALLAYYFYNCKNKAINKKFLELWFWKASLSNRYSGSTFTKIGEDRAYIFDRSLRGEEPNINYDINVDIEKIKNVNMGRVTALRNALLLILMQQEPLSFMDNSPIDIEMDSISEFNQSEKHHVFPKKFLKSIEIKDKKTTDLLMNFCLIDSVLNKSISGKSPKEYLSEYQKRNSDLKKALHSHLIPSDKDSGIWENNYNKFIEQRAELILRQVKTRVGDFTATIEEQINTNPSMLIQKLEQNIREMLNVTLYESLGENWWEIEGIVPQDVKEYAQLKIKKEKANKPYISDAEWKMPARLLEQITIPQYLKIICANWNKFEDIFGTKGNLERAFDDFSNIRNQIDHIKTMESTERKRGEASIEWLFKCIQKNEIKQAEDEISPELYTGKTYTELKEEILKINKNISEKKHSANWIYFKKENGSDGFAYLRKQKTQLILLLEFPNDAKFQDPKKLLTLRKKYSAFSEYLIKISSDAFFDDLLVLIKQAYELDMPYKTEIYDETHVQSLVNPEIYKVFIEFRNQLKKLTSYEEKINKFFIGFKNKKNYFAIIEARKSSLNLGILETKADPSLFKDERILYYPKHKNIWIKLFSKEDIVKYLPLVKLSKRYGKE